MKILYIVLLLSNFLFLQADVILKSDQNSSVKIVDDDFFDDSFGSKYQVLTFLTFF